MNIISEQHVLFNVGPLEAMDAVDSDNANNKIDLTMNPRHVKHYANLVKRIRNCIGKPVKFITRPYRIAGERYIVIVIEGLKTHLNLTLSIAGYLRWPPEHTIGRLYMDIADAVDAYYLSEYLKQDLLLNSTP
jgi:hypothetical protein